MTVELLKRVAHWHHVLALQIAALNPNLPLVEPDRVARHLMLALLCLPLYRQRNLMTAAEIQICSYELVRSRLLQINRDYGHLFPISGLPAQISVNDEMLTAALYELTSASFAVEFLGQAYESCLGQSRSLSLPVSPTASLNPSPPATAKKIDAKKSGGVYYTPAAVAEYIVQQTVGKLLTTCSVCDGESSDETLRLENGASLHGTLPPEKGIHAQLPRVLDPSCGGGVFLLTAYRLLLAHRTAHLTDQSGTSDPCCTRLTQAERSHILLQCICGVDIDPDAVAVTRLSLLLVLLEEHPEELPARLLEERLPLPDLRYTIRCGNSLIDCDWKQPSSLAPEVWGEPLDWAIAFPAAHSSGGFDAVIGNPPYLDSEWMTVHLPQHRRHCTQRYQVATGNWDLFCVFIEKALELCKPGGLTSLVVPNKLASAEYAAAARSLLTHTSRLLALRDYSRVAVFVAAVYPLVFLAQKPEQKSPPLPQGHIRYEQMRSLEQVDYWHWFSTANRFVNPKAPWPLSGETPHLTLMARLAQQFPMLAVLAEVKGAATVAEAYALQPLIQEWQRDDPHALRVVNSGTLDRYRVRWGEKRLRYLGASYLQPVVAGHLLEYLSLTRQQQAAQPKILVAGMTKRLECALDATGAILAAKSTCIIQLDKTSELDLRYLLGILNSRLMQVYFTQYFAGNAFQGGYLRVGPPQLRQLPIPCAAPELRDRLISLVATMLELCDRPQPHESLCEPTGSLESNLEAIAKLDREIDQVVYEIYQLSQSEITTLEN